MRTRDLRLKLSREIKKNEIHIKDYRDRAEEYSIRINELEQVNQSLQAILNETAPQKKGTSDQ